MSSKLSKILTAVIFVIAVIAAVLFINVFIAEENENNEGNYLFNFNLQKALYTLPLKKNIGFKVERRNDRLMITNQNQSVKQFNLYSIDGKLLQTGVLQQQKTIFIQPGISYILNIKKGSFHMKISYFSVFYLS